MIMKIRRPKITKKRVLKKDTKKTYGRTRRKCIMKKRKSIKAKNKRQGKRRRKNKKRKEKSVVIGKIDAKSSTLKTDDRNL